MRLLSLADVLFPELLTGLLCGAVVYREYLSRGADRDELRESRTFCAPVLPLRVGGVSAH